MTKFSENAVAFGVTDPLGHLLDGFQGHPIPVDSKAIDGTLANWQYLRHRSA